MEEIRSSGHEINFGESTLGDPQRVTGQMGAVTRGSLGIKKKMGRPRKYGPEGKPKVALSPMPISSSIPIAGDYSGWNHSPAKSLNSINEKQKVDLGISDERVAHSAGANFTPHLIIVNVGEDVNKKIISFAQQGSRAICVITATGAISNVTLHQPNSCGGTLTYEGLFEILSLSGAFMPKDIGGVKGRSGGMSVSLAGPDGRVLGGGLAGMLLAAGPVQVVVGSFVVGNQHEQQEKPKKSRFETIPAAISTPMSPQPIDKEDADVQYVNSTPITSMHEATNVDTELNVSFHGSESIESHSSQSQVSS